MTRDVGFVDTMSSDRRYKAQQRPILPVGHKKLVMKYSGKMNLKQRKDEFKGW